MFRKSMILATALLSLNASNALGQTVFYPEKESGEWYVGGQIYSDNSPICGIRTFGSDKDGSNPMVFAIAVPATDDKYPFVMVVGPGDTFRLKEETKLIFFFDLPNGKKDSNRLTVAPNEGGESAIGLVNLEMFLDAFVKGERMNIIYPEGNFLSFSLNGSTKAVFVYLKECMKAANKLYK